MGIWLIPALMEGNVDLERKYPFGLSGLIIRCAYEPRLMLEVRTHEMDWNGLKFMFICLRHRPHRGCLLRTLAPLSITIQCLTGPIATTSAPILSSFRVLRFWECVFPDNRYRLPAPESQQG
jgi:hypothetical protein